MSKNTITLTNVNNAGKIINNNHFGGVFIPGVGHVANRFETTIMLNTIIGRNADGTWKEKRIDFRITAWDGRNIAPGETGRAVQFARECPIGQEITSIELRPNPFKLTMKDNGQPIFRKDGSPVEVTVMGWDVMDVTFAKHNPKKIVLAEIAAWDGQMGWGKRPPGYEGFARQDLNGRVKIIPGSVQGDTAVIDSGLLEAHAKLWAELKQLRKINTIYRPGLQVLGYAAVRLPSTTQATEAQERFAQYESNAAHYEQHSGPVNTQENVHYGTTNTGGYQQNNSGGYQQNNGGGYQANTNGYQANTNNYNGNTAGGGAWQQNNNANNTNQNTSGQFHQVI